MFVTGGLQLTPRIEKISSNPPTHLIFSLHTHFAYPTAIPVASFDFELAIDPTEPNNSIF
jgi:hypothetical protein